MKLLLILFALSPMIAPNTDSGQLRLLYAEAAKDEQKAKQLIRETEGEKNNTLYRGYLGAGKMVMAKYYFNPFSKFSSFKKGKEILESAIKSDKTNPELRYLRLTIQKNSPTFLGYDKNIGEDQAYLIKSLFDMKDDQLKSIIYKYLKSI